MSADDAEKCNFLIMATLTAHQPYSRPFFVRAASIREAYQEVLKHEMFQTPTVRLEAFIIDSEQVAAVMPLSATEELLRKYIRHVGIQEGVTFIDGATEGFTEDEVAILERLESRQNNA